MPDNRYTNNPLRNAGGLTTNNPQDPQPVNNEDFWQNPAAPVLWTFLYPNPFSFEQHDPGSLSGQPDEDFWINPVAAVPANLLAPQPFLFEQHDPSTLSGEPDEDFWINPVAPLWESLLWPQPFTFEQHDPSTLFGQMDEDFWIVPFMPSLSNLWPSPWTFDVQELASTPFIPTEDYWVRMAAGYFTIGALLHFDAGEIVQAASPGPPIEDFWQNQTAPIAAKNLWQFPWKFDVQEVVSYIPPPPTPTSATIGFGRRWP